MLHAHKSDYFIKSFCLFHRVYEMTTMWLTVVDFLMQCFYVSRTYVQYNPFHF